MTAQPQPRNTDDLPPNTNASEIIYGSIWAVQTIWMLFRAIDMIHHQNYQLLIHIIDYNYSWFMNKEGKCSWQWYSILTSTGINEYTTITLIIISVILNACAV